MECKLNIRPLECIIAKTYNTPHHVKIHENCRWSTQGSFFGFQLLGFKKKCSTLMTWKFQRNVTGPSMPYSLIPQFLVVNVIFQTLRP